ncbi:DUF1217 domain-containing protein [Tropicimonas sp. TH_r6]|uniref:DUF1217 domain-containing protein n=1 Tax=Tropicimonas sp. TH_r6 TaxID=3082085 RepID=UPI002955709A|nr:DUF1217 domain-containing protein [Tropicimonas sp. TH_r6]MDV7144782.1 DUF1217 domain-containing protein [Tropicimonas sp. TH_r6]
MTFQPVVPISGYAGWVFLNRTLETQQEAHKQGLQSDTEYFSENIGNVRTVDDLLADRKLLTVALGAFGLDDDINNTFFIRKVLEEGTSDSESLANKLSDSTYLEFSTAFGFGEGIPPRTTLSGFAEEVTSAYESYQFETDVGDQNEDFRLALYAERELPDVASEDTSNDTKWFTIMGSTPLRTVFETALGLPDSFASLDIDVQLKTFKAKAEQTFGTSEVSDYLDPQLQDELTSTFLLRSELKNGAQSLTSANTALILLGG